MVAVKKNQPATIQNTNESVRRFAVVEVEISSAESNAPGFLARGGSLDTFVISKPPHKRKIRPLLHRLASSLRRSVLFRIWGVAIN